MNDAADHNADFHQSRLPLFPHVKSRAPFIADQGLQWLKTADGIRPLECLDPARFREARRAVEDRGEPSHVELPAGCEWNEIATEQERVSFLANTGQHASPKFHRLVLMIEAGMGKTTAVQQVLYLRNCACPGQLAMGFNFSRLPTRAEDYLDNQRLWLCEQFKNLDILKHANVRDVYRLILRKITNREFTLVVDSFDQVSKLSRSDIIDRATALNDFVNRYPEVRVVCAGRPNSIIDMAPDLFDVGEWVFAQIKGFNETQQKEYVGQDRVDALKIMEVELLSQPRMLEAIRKLKPIELRGLRTASALHWKVLEHVVGKAYKSNPSPLGISKMQRLVSAIAFQLHEEENFDGINQDQFDDFVVRLTEKRGDALTRFFKDAAAIENAVDELGKLNELLDFAVLEDGKQRQIYFRNRTLQAFFAALWCTKYSSQTNDIEVLRQHLYIRGAYENHFQNGDYYEFWRFATEIPGKVRGDDLHYVRSMSALFLPPPEPDPERQSTGSLPRRSTEMIYRSWWQLLEIANKKVYQCEQEMMSATRQLQHQVRSEFESGAQSFTPCAAWSADPRTHARFLLQQYLLEFLALSHGQLGSTEQQQLAADFDRRVAPDVDGYGFLKIPAGKFWFGEPAKEETLPEAFLLARYPITNELIRLFDPTHGMEKARFSDYAEFSSDPKCPAIYVDWYTAISASIWLGGELPDEYAWERACRGLQNVAKESATKYYSGNKEKDLAKVAYYTVNSGDVSHPIGVSSDGKMANNFGLKHMHGSVWEWTHTWFADKPIEGKSVSYVSRFRVARGGSFLSVSDCRSAFHVSGRPAGTFHGSGFGVSRALPLP